MQQPTRLISTPFAQEGEKTEIQNVTGEFDNSATYRLGFPPLTMQSIRSGGKPPKGTDFNGVLFDITENISFLCKGGRYQYNAGLSTLIGGYLEGSNLLLDDNVTEVVSTVAGNQNNPNTDMTGWILKPNRTTAVNVADASGETQQQVNYNGGAKWHSRVGGYLENERVVLANGDIVKSTIDGNVNDPNVDMTGWVPDFDTSAIQTEISTINTELSLKADTAYVDVQNSLKADKTYVDTTFAAYVGGRKAYTTLALAQAAQAALTANTAIEVTNDGANNGTYQWDGTTLTKSDYDPLTRSKNYTDEAVKTSSNIALTNSGLTLTEDQLKVSMINFIGTLTNPIDVNFPETTGKWVIRNGTLGAQVITLKSGAFSVILPVGHTITVYKPTNTSIFRTDADKAPLVNPVFINATMGTAAAGTNNLVLANTTFAHRVSHGALTLGITDDVALTEAQAGVKTLTFNGTLTKDVTVTVPFSQGSWNVKNDTTGGFSIKFKSANPPFAIIPNGESRACFANSSSMNMLPVGIQSLPTASKTQAGMVIVGNGLNVDAQGLLSVESGGGVETSKRTISVLNTTTVAGVSTPSARIMSDDGMICFGIESRYLKVSFDWGKTFAGTIFDAGSGKSISQVRDTNDGELICVLIDGTVTPQTQAIYKTTGWNKKAIAQTWTKVLEVQKPGVTLNFNWGFSKHRNIIICTEYGAKVGVQTQNMPPEGAQPGENARYVYMTKDNGDTWSIIFDVNAVTDGEGVHIHGVAFDEFWNRIWASFGDGFLGTNGLCYSDDFGTTWESALETQDKGINFAQTVHIVPMKTCILFASDSYPNGIHRIDRAQGKTPTKGWYDIDTTAYLLENQMERLNYLCHSVSKPKFLPDMPVTFAFGAETVVGYSQVVSTFDGWTFFPLWKDPVISPVGFGCRNVIGPTYENEIIIHSFNNDRVNPWERTTLKVAVE